METENFLKLKKEVDELEERYSASHSDPSMSLERRVELADEYISKYKELERIALKNISPYNDHDQRDITSR